MKTITAQQMRDLERAAIESGAVTGIELMERAGQGVVEAVMTEWPDLAEGRHRAVVLCGPGNNGGDGFVVARLLKERGWDTDVFLVGPPGKLPPDARTNHDRYARRAPVRPVTDVTVRELTDSPRHLMVDALFGIGLTRPITDPNLLEILRQVDDALEAQDAADAGHPGPIQPPRTLAIDLPSGLDSDTGTVLGAPPPHGARAARVMLTVTFHLPKPAHITGPDYGFCGKVVVKDIGL